jgi:uncharacterized protein (DUF1330 family)
VSRRTVVEDNHESQIWHCAIDDRGSSIWWCCHPGSACAGQAASLYDRLNEVSDQARYANEYVSPARKSVTDHGGEYVAAGPGTQVAGNLPRGPVVILRWQSMEALQAWFNSPDFQAALKIGEKYAKFNIVAVDGLK